MVRYGETSLRKKEYRDTYKSILFEEQVESKKNELVREFDKKVKKIKNETSTIQDKINSDEEQMKLLKERNDLISSKKASIENEISAIQCQIEQYDEQLKLLKDRRESFSSKYDNIDNQITTLKERIVLEEHIFSTSIFRKIFRRSKYKEKMIEMQDQLNKLLSQKNELFIEIQNIEHSIISHHSECIEKIPELQNQASKLSSQKNELIAEMKYDEQSISALELNIAQNKENLKIIKNEYYKLQEDKNLALKNIEVKVLKENFAILTTNLRASNNIFETINFDIVIMDEAGAIDLPSAAIVLTRSSKVVFLGDHKQLPPIIQENSLEVRIFLRKYPEIKRSIFEILYKKYYKKDCLIMLENQYRMKKEIADFISNQFYDGRIKSPSEIHGILKNTNDAILSAENPVVLFKRKFKTEFEGKSSYNISEIRFIRNIIAKFEQEYGKEIKNKISIVTPYRAQLEHLKEELQEIDCGTVHTYQGQEKEIVIFSTVKYKKGINGFGQLFDGEKGDNLLNVAMSRAKEKFIIIGGYALFQNVKTYNELYKFIENIGLIIKEPISGYDSTLLNKCSICGDKIEPYQTQCSDCKQLYIMQTMQEQIPRSKKCVDGDLVRSIGEILIDNWLHSNNIKHQVEQKIPIPQLKYCDWYLPDYDTYIEFWGDIHTKYPEARRVKERLYQKNKLKLVSIEIADIDNLDEILKYKLKLRNDG